MSDCTQVLFVQGGGAGVHDDWDARLVADLERALGAGYEVRYPRMPQEDDPGFATWSAAIGGEVAALDDGAVLVGHSVGGTILVGTVAEAASKPSVRAIVLIAAPFVGPGGWPSSEFEFPSDLGSRLPGGASVHLFHGSADEAVPPAHVDLYARAIPGAHVHRLPGRDHQLGDDLSEVAAAIMA